LSHFLVAHRVYDTPGNANGVQVVGNYAYVTDGYSGLQIIDISNPTAPILKGSYNTHGASGVQVVGNYAYVANFSFGGLDIIDISNPTVPIFRGSYNTHGAYGVQIVDNYAYVADGYGGLKIIDVSNFTNPQSPTNLALSNSTIAENQARRTVVGTFTSTDSNTSDSFTYRLVTGTGDTDNALFAISGTQLQSNAVFDFETQNSYSIRVRTTDQSGLTFEKQLTIGVTDINETPTNLTLFNTSIAENQAVGTIVGTLTTTDSDTGNTFTYSLVTGTGSTDNALFTIVGNQLRSNGIFDFETKNSYSIRVRSTDQGGLSFEKQLIIGVTNLNERPTDLTLSNTSIAENQTVGTAIGTFTTTDSDRGNTFTYSLVTGTGSTDNALFTIVGNQLRSNGIFDFETKNSYSIRVRSTDQGGLSFEKQLIIGVTNLNERPTDLTLSNTSIAENQTVGTAIGTFSSTHPNTGNTFTYSLVTGLGDINNALFAITGNQLQSNSIFDFETKNTYSIRVRTTDQGGLTFEKQLTIGITNVDEQRSLFLTSQQDIFINEGLDDTVTGTFANLQQNDNINSGAGIDTLVLSEGIASNTVTINASTSTNQLNIAGTMVKGFERFDLNGFLGKVTYIGTTANDWVKTGAGADILNGGVGIDTLIGGLDNDTYTVDNVGDIVTETSTLTTEIDTVNSSVTYTLSENVERLTLTGTANIDGIGNTLANTITGNSGNNILEGGLGNDILNGGVGIDTLIGGLDNDTYTVDNVGDIVTETSTLATEIDTVNSSVTYTLSENVERLTLTGTANIDGIGNTLANTITGNSGNNILEGGLGIDTLIGGLGNDTYTVDNVGDIVTETSTLATEIDTVNSSVTYTLSANVEKLTLTGTANINGTGNTLANTITGNSGNNTLAGLAGNDTLAGLAGNDIYSFLANTVLGTDTITETTTGGIDTLNFSGTNNQVRLNLGSITNQIVVTGNLILQLSAVDVIENVIGGNSGDRLTGNSLNNSLDGNGGNDNLNGGNGVDILTGGTGDDILTGGAGNDSFAYVTGKAFTTGDIGLDTLTDFTPTADKLLLSKTTFAALTSIVGNGFSQATDFAIVEDDSLVEISNAFIVYNSNSSSLFYNQNGNAAGLGTGAEFAVLINNPTLTSNDFTLVA
jgi:Ca2+-binding RTX toxin-like protein